ncbi:hypothetical protein D7X96_20155 [Corallococcus interemptor]|uniref:Glucose/Sorbosone dehydrogenase domain-containing protein n=1 Tax=Corallococcus interemptor TaxID=2316720 RepID=A0A3A8QHJ4_9BACT|nr:PQQ-dependent sugar dehydrogenase [Corallococcus interemptor]RKH67171.1 hypothetical protein D7X96_20155 [Corallococcus interemptor]
MRSLLPWLALALLTAFAAQAQFRIPIPPPGAYGTEVTTFAGGDALLEASGLIWAPDASNRLFVLLKSGKVQVIQNGSLLPTPFINEPVGTEGEQGLQSLVFDPDFATNHYVYVFVTRPDFTYTAQILRFMDVGGVGINRTVIVDDIPAGTIHNGGGMAFGPDGLLYFGVGDRGTKAGGGDDLTLLASKINRVHKDGTTPSDNPFYDGDGPNNDLIWARGFRNPFRMRFEPGTGKLWVNVAGEVSEQIFRVGRGDHAGWATYENNQPEGFLTPLVAYLPGSWELYFFTPTGAVRQNGVTTFTVQGSQPVTALRKGRKVTVREVLDPSFNGTWIITGFPTPYSFTVDQPGPDAASGGGWLRTDIMGEAVVGGAFSEGSLFPAEYQGNYFFADFTGNVYRVVLATDGTVERVPLVLCYDDREVFTDVAMGPDGALYVMSYAGAIYRLTPVPAGQGVVASEQDLAIPEGGTKTFTVSLAMPPSAPTYVLVERREEDSDIRVTSGQELLFTAANWNVPRTVTLSAAQDADADIDHATITFSMDQGYPAGIPGAEVHVRTEEDEVQSLQLSATAVDLEEGSSDTFTVALAYAPTAPLTVTVARTSGSEDVSLTGGATLTFAPQDGTAAKTVTLAAAQDADGEDDLAVLTVSAPGLASRTVSVTARDVASVPVITSTPATQATVGVPYAYTVTATGRPAPSLVLEEGPQGMTLDPESGLLSWTSQAEATVAVAVRASNGQAPDAVQTFQLQVQQPEVADAGTEPDGGGIQDAGTSMDAGIVADAGSTQDGGTVPNPMGGDVSGCGCGATAIPGVLGWWLLSGLLWKPRRARR